MHKSPIGVESAVLRELLTSFRQKQNIHQSTLAQRLGRHQSYVSKYEIGERRLNFIEVIEICLALNINPHQLLDEYLERINNFPHKIF